MIIILFSEEKKSNAPPTTRIIMDRFSYLSSLLNVSSRNCDTLEDLWLSRHHWWSEDMLVCSCEGPWEAMWSLESHDGSWESMIDLGRPWLILGSHGGSGEVR